MSQQNDIIAALRPLPFPHELQTYLLDFTAGITGKLKPAPGFIHNPIDKKSLFVTEGDINDVLETMRNVFRTHGYLKPWELENAVINQYHPDISSHTLFLSDQLSAETREPEHLTSFYSKDHVPMITGLAALYHQATGKPVNAIELDFSNMRGTNEHFARLLAVAEGRSEQSVMHDAEMMTDHIALIVCNAIRMKVAEDYPDQDFVPMRAGGDEVRIILPDADTDTVAHMLDDIHKEIEIVTAALGQHDHSHHKRRDVEQANGFGAGGAILPIVAEGHKAYSEKIKEIDQLIKDIKLEIGQNRINNPTFDNLKPFTSKDPARYTDPDVAGTHLIELNTAMAEMHQRLIDYEQEPEATPRLEAMAKSILPDHFLTLSQIRREFREHLAEILKNEGYTLPPDQEKAILIKITKFPANDFATGTLSARDFSPMAGAALQVVEDISTRTGHTEKPIIMGVSFHNLAGLNDTLGHELANMTLHHMARNIVEKSFEKIGIASENIVLAHMGGGEFRAVIQPVIPEADSSVRIISDDDLSTARKAIRKNLSALNNCHIQDFLTFNGHDSEYLDLPDRFADIENPREDVRPTENGLTATVVTARYDTDLHASVAAQRKGSLLNDHLGKILHSEIAFKRDREKNATDQTTPVTHGPQP